MKKALKTARKFADHGQILVAIDSNRKFIWIQTIKAYEQNVIIRGYNNFHLKRYINGLKPKWSKLRIQDLKEFVKRLNSIKDGSKTSQMFLEKYAELKVELNAKNEDEFQDTIFHFACCYGHSKMVNLLLTESANLNINLNARNEYGHTAFHLACIFGRKDIVEIMIRAVASC